MPTTYATAFAAHHARGSTLRPRDTTFRPRDTMVHRPTMLRPRDTMVHRPTMLRPRDTMVHHQPTTISPSRRPRAPSAGSEKCRASDRRPALIFAPSSPHLARRAPRVSVLAVLSRP